MRIVERDTFFICGYVVETTAAQNDEDLSALFADFFDNDHELDLLELKGSKKGYYGLSWYTQEHEKYCYLLGIEVGDHNEPPQNTQIKTLTRTTYAVEGYSHDKGVIEAWNEFFFTDIPQAGLAPNDDYNLYFEYYPKDVRGDFELWVPVIPA